MQRSFKSICHRHPSTGKFLFKFSHPFFNYSKYWNKFQLNSSIFFHSNFIIDLRTLAIKLTRSFQSCLPNDKSETSSNKLPYSVILLKKINKGADPEAIIWQKTCGRACVGHCYSEQGRALHSNTLESRLFFPVSNGIDFSSIAMNFEWVGNHFADWNGSGEAL